MNRHELEQRIWRNLRFLGLDRNPLAVNVVDNLLDNADAYAATREDLRTAARLAAQERDTPLLQQERRDAACLDAARWRP